MSIIKYQTLDSYLAEIESQELSELLKEIITISLDVPKQILTFLLGAVHWFGIPVLLCSNR